MSKELLSKFYDSVVLKQDEDAYDAFSQYVEAQAKALAAELRAGNSIVEESEKPVRLKGNDILVNGKKTGTISHDHEKDDGISYTSEDGKKSTHESLSALFSHLAKEHGLNESVDDNLHVLSTRKKGSRGKWGAQFSGSKAECKQEWKDTKHDWEGHDHKIHRHNEKHDDED